MKYNIQMEILYLVGIIGLIGMGAGALYTGNHELANNIALGLIGFIGGGAIRQSKITNNTA